MIILYAITKLGCGIIHTKNLLLKQGLNYITLQQSSIAYNSKTVRMYRIYHKTKTGEITK